MQLKSTLQFQARRASEKSNDRRSVVSGPRKRPVKYPDSLVRTIHIMRDQHRMSAGAIHANLTSDGEKIPLGWVRSVWASAIRTNVR